MSFLERIVSCDPAKVADYSPFIIDGAPVGVVEPALARALKAHGDVFVADGGALGLAPTLDTLESRTEAVEGVLRKVYEAGDLDDWRDERFPVSTAFAAPALLHIDRGAVPRMGITGYGVHVNGLVGDSMWIGRRAADKKLSPNKLDQVVAGGQPAGLGLRENLIKEAAEEADIPAGIASRAVPVGCVSYCVLRPEGLRRDVLFNFDLELPSDFEPRNTDGEISEFYLWPMERVIETVRDTAEFKFNCSMVIIDYLIRTGRIEADHSDYEALVKGLHGGL